MSKEKYKDKEREKLIAALRRLSRDVKNEGLHAIDIEDGELAHMLDKAADLLENKE